MCPLQPGMQLTSLIPKEWPTVVIDLKDFFTIPLQGQDKENFAFMVPNTIILCQSRDMNGRFCHREC